jgi:hypothetical protein
MSFPHCPHLPALVRTTSSISGARTFGPSEKWLSLSSKFCVSFWSCLLVTVVSFVGSFLWKVGEVKDSCFLFFLFFSLLPFVRQPTSASNRHIIQAFQHCVQFIVSHTLFTFTEQVSKKKKKNKRAGEKQVFHHSQLQTKGKHTLGSKLKIDSFFVRLGTFDFSVFSVGFFIILFLVQLLEKRQFKKKTQNK